MDTSQLKQHSALVEMRDARVIADAFMSAASASSWTPPNCKQPIVRLERHVSCVHEVPEFVLVKVKALKSRLTVAS